MNAGYGFVDFDSEQAAELAVKALKAEGQQAQMARVCIACWFEYDVVGQGGHLGPSLHNILIFIIQ